MDHSIFDAQVAALAGNYRVLSWDVRGHGLSRPIGPEFSIRRAADDLLFILDHIGCQQAIFVGHSMGGFITQEVIFAHPERVIAAVMIGSMCITMKKTAAIELIKPVSVPCLRLCPDFILKRVMAYSAGLNNNVRKCAEAACRKVPKKDFLKIWKALTLCEHYEKNYKITCPLLITHGQHDNLVGFGLIKRYASIWAAREGACKYKIIPNAGHNAHQDNPEFFNQLLQNFLGELLLSDD